MKRQSTRIKLSLIAYSAALILTAARADDPPEIRTPAAPPAPRINGAAIFGVRPDHPFLYHIPATGDRPIQFSADKLPNGLTLDPATGNITGVLHKTGEYKVTFHAKNSLGAADKNFKIVVGETISLTPAMGWNSWNHYAGRITQDIVLQNAKAMAESGLIDHGWSYVNIDDTWQGERGGPFHGLQGNEKFPDLKALCDQIHALGLRFGIYSTPWETSYATFPGGSSENPEGKWTKPEGKTVKNKKILPCAIAPYRFYTNDASQWGAWGVDYLKYDWNPIEAPETKEMGDALRHSGRDIIFSLSNNLNITNAPDVTPLANSWRTTGDIKANWKSMTDRGFGQDKWRKYSKPGHWNDPDMLVVGKVGWGSNVHDSGLTPDEQYTHISLWCLVCSPLLIGCPIDMLDEFTLSLLTNDEVLEVSQDPLGQAARRIAQNGDTEVWAKSMEDGSMVVGLFNRFDYAPQAVTLKLADLKAKGDCTIRDLWRQKDLGTFKGEYSAEVPVHGVVLLRVTAK
jgi:alpha-galactosidase